MKQIALIPALVIFCVGAFALEFVSTPNNAGSLDLYLGQSWRYSDDFYSSIIFRNESEIAENVSGDSYVHKTIKRYELDADLLGYRVEFGNDPLVVDKPALSFTFKLFYENALITDVSSQTGTSSLISLKENSLSLLYPVLTCSFQMYIFNDVGLSLSLGYSPLLLLRQNQSLEIDPGANSTDYREELALFQRIQWFTEIRWLFMKTGIRGSYAPILFQDLTQAGLSQRNDERFLLAWETIASLSFLRISDFVPSLGFEVRIRSGANLNWRFLFGATIGEGDESREGAGD